MSDFYQILQREIKPKEEKPEVEKIKDSDMKSDNLIFSKPKKSLGRKKKAGTIKKKKTIKKTAKKKTQEEEKEEAFKPKTILSKDVTNEIWLTLAEAAKLGGVQKKTIKRAILSNNLKYKIVDNRYQVDLRSLILYVYSKIKLLNKLNNSGLGQYIKTWKE
jgi:hypothetical protein